MRTHSIFYGKSVAPAPRSNDCCDDFGGAAAVALTSTSNSKAVSAKMTDDGAVLLHDTPEDIRGTNSFETAKVTVLNGLCEDETSIGDEKCSSSFDRFFSVVCDRKLKSNSNSTPPVSKSLEKSDYLEVHDVESPKPMKKYWRYARCKTRLIPFVERRIIFRGYWNMKENEAFMDDSAHEALKFFDLQCNEVIDQSPIDLPTGMDTSIHKIDLTESRAWVQELAIPPLIPKSILRKKTKKDTELSSEKNKNPVIDFTFRLMPSIIMKHLRGSSVSFAPKVNVMVFEREHEEAKKDSRWLTQEEILNFKREFLRESYGASLLNSKRKNYEDGSVSEEIRRILLVHQHRCAILILTSFVSKLFPLSEIDSAESIDDGLVRITAMKQSHPNTKGLGFDLIIIEEQLMRAPINCRRIFNFNIYNEETLSESPLSCNILEKFQHEHKYIDDSSKSLIIALSKKSQGNNCKSFEDSVDLVWTLPLPKVTPEFRRLVYRALLRKRRKA